MQDKEIKNWQNEQALKRYQLITPLLDPDVDEGKRTAAGRDRRESRDIEADTLPV